jgi:hypothetical protein
MTRTITMRRPAPPRPHLAFSRGCLPRAPETCTTFTRGCMTSVARPTQIERPPGACLKFWRGSGLPGRTLSMWGVLRCGQSRIRRANGASESSPRWFPVYTWHNFWAGDPIFRSQVKAVLSEPFRHLAHSMYGQGSLPLCTSCVAAACRGDLVSDVVFSRVVGAWPMRSQGVIMFSLVLAV